ncbi:MAG: hypothetical protein ABJB01_11055 [Rudaea sp.]
MKLSQTAETSHSPTLRIAVIGATGRIGRRTVELIDRRVEEFAPLRLRPRIVFASNSRAFVIDAEGNAADDFQNGAGTALSANWDALLTNTSPHIIIDCTASAQIASRYPAWLARGIDVVTPNKHASSSDRTLRNAIERACASSGAEVRDATTVGAQLPLLASLRELRRAGDRLVRLEAVLSGTLSYVLGSVQNGASLSQSIGEAVALGYAEPDPACDLSGTDAARKLVILLRAAGIEIELNDVERVPLLDVGGEPWLDAAAAVDEVWRARAALAQARRETWVYRASYENGSARIAPERVPIGHPLARLAPCENALILHSDFYRAAPLTISGPGAGIELTAAGVFADVLAAACRHRHIAADSNVIRLPQPSRAVAAACAVEALAAT